MKIQIDLILQGDAVVYPGDFNKWYNTSIISDKLVGYYSGTPNFAYEEYVEPPKHYGRKITRLAFENRWTTNELVAVDLASTDNPSGTLQERQLAASVRVFKSKQNNATYIDLDLQETQLGVQSILSLLKVVLGYTDPQVAQRYDQIINTPVAEKEVPIWISP